MEKAEYVNLVQAAVNGNLSSFEQLIQHHYKLLERYVACRIASKMESEDILQEILLIAWLNIGKLKYPEAFKSWLLRIAGNRCKRWYAEKDRTPTPLEDEMLESILNRHQQFQRKSPLDSELNTAIDQLPAIQRQTIHDFYFHELKIREIAHIRGVPEGTVKRRLHESRRNLKKRMENKK